ncbi:hypothetical protein WICMUC_003663 [Wickerhamomyces mucosus]|uniref:Oligomycin resistance ATP-dependent permease YOR1 n=1 Tax=Wickerhamomyces mucosus TaxID=1378264 RepID=A0A9P8PK87_9ASCO|nr:hypothetical protein WICMUC_003663 [Wickerhamomyces mucosus]
MEKYREIDSSESSKQPFDLEASQIQQTKPVKRLFTPLLNKKVPPIPDESEKKPLPIFSSNPLAYIIYSWLFPMLNVGYKRTLTQNDLWYLHGELSIHEAYRLFTSNFDRRIKDSKKIPKLAIPLSIFDSFRIKLILAVSLRIFANLAQCFAPLLIKKLIQYVQEKADDSTLPLNKGAGYAVGVALLASAQTILSNQSLLLSSYVGAQAKTILTKSLLEKSLIADSFTRKKFDGGSIISLLGSDLSRIGQGITEMPVAFATPFPIVVGVILLIINVKVSALAGIASFLLFMCFVGFPMSIYMKLRNQANIYTDKRVSLMREIIQSMKFIKLYAWEDAYQKIIVNLRSKESSFVFKMQYIMATSFSVVLSISNFTSMVVFLTLYGIKGLDSSAPIIFSSLSLINVLTSNIIDLPGSLAAGTDAIISFGRMKRYLESPNEENIELYFDNEIIKDDNIAIKISDAEFQYQVSSKNDEEKKTKDNDDSESVDISEELELVSVLENVNLEIKKGEFVIITGAMGTGKSSLLAAIFGLIQKKSGKVAVNGSSLLCDSPWIENSTVRQNITFGSDYEATKYQKVVQACALSDDLKAFPAGDLTEIGERGVTLSGGQKSRINLARTIYADPDILVFDDVLNAVDANVGEYIMSNLFLDLIKHKTRILTTHQLSVLDKADRIIFLGGDRTIYSGTKDKLMATNKQFESLIHEFGNKTDVGAKDDLKLVKVEGSSKTEVGDARLIQDEERAVNSIPLAIYLKYIKAGQGALGMLSIPLLLLATSLGTFTTFFINVWLTYWLETKFENLSNGQYIAIYVTLTFISSLLIGLQFGILGYIIVESSKNLTISSIKNILHTPMKFLDATPTGRILNRFSKDVNSLDNELGNFLQLFLYLVFSVVGVLILAIVYVPYFAIALPFIILLCFFMANYYQASSREVKRLEAINRSFILNNFNEVLTGLSTIKIFKSQSRFISKNDEYVDKLNEVFFVVIANQRWISTNLGIVACALSFLVSMLTVSRQFNISAAATGLLTSYMLQFNDLLTFSLTIYSELENEMNSVERIMHYAYNLEQEPPYRIEETQPENSWPAEGSIQFEKASFRYRKELPLILKDFSLSIEGGEKIGICGRTGAGKSSLMTALYRLSELEAGKIIIDGIDISKIGSFDLRSKLSIIPQDPVLFQGTLRRNLDPFEERTDAELWDALRRSNLISESELEEFKQQTTDNLGKFHLDINVEAEGSNFSLGERQLIALARALVRKTKILVMDEATSSVDYKTDQSIQNTINSEFAKSTVLCIAHRLKTILKYDKILVLDKGELKQFGKPEELFHDKSGLFRNMCDSSNIVSTDF